MIDRDPQPPQAVDHDLSISTVENARQMRRSFCERRYDERSIGEALRSGRSYRSRDGTVYRDDLAGVCHVLIAVDEAETIAGR